MSRTICGTPAYVAPEVIMCMEGTRRSYDVRPRGRRLAIPRVPAAESSQRTPVRAKHACGAAAASAFSAVSALPSRPVSDPPSALPRPSTPQPFLADTWSLGCNFYILLCGHSAFWPYEDNDAALFKAIKGGVIDWAALDKQQNVSAAAKGIVRMMLVTDPQHRAKVDQLALHPWVTGELAASTKEMPETLEGLRKFVANRRWKRAGLVALAKGRFNAIAAGLAGARKESNAAAEAAAQAPQ